MVIREVRDILGRKRFNLGLQAWKYDPFEEQIKLFLYDF